jgi:hypothetical protein
MSLVISQTAVQRVIPGASLGRVTSVFLAGEAAATLAGAVVGPALAGALQLGGAADAASLATLLAALTSFLLVPSQRAGQQGRAAGRGARPEPGSGVTAADETRACPSAARRGASGQATGCCPAGEPAPDSQRPAAR